MTFVGIAISNLPGRAGPSVFRVSKEVDELRPASSGGRVVDLLQPGRDNAARSLASVVMICAALRAAARDHVEEGTIGAAAACPTST